MELIFFFGMACGIFLYIEAIWLSIVVTGVIEIIRKRKNKN